MTWTIGTAILLVGFAAGWIVYELTDRALWRKFNKHHKH